MSSHFKDLTPDELSTEESLKRYKVTRLIGYSMYPTLQENDVLFLEVLPPSQMKVGDLIVFSSKTKDKTICHRLVGKRFKNGKWIFKEKGDNCFGSSRITEEQIIARVKDYYRGRQHFFASNPLLARFNIIMALVFKVIYIGKWLKKKLLPGIKIGFLFKPILRRINGLNRLGNKQINRRFNRPE